jgi:hypothetical protein
MFLNHDCNFDCLLGIYKSLTFNLWMWQKSHQKPVPLGTQMYISYWMMGTYGFWCQVEYPKMVCKIWDCITCWLILGNLFLSLAEQAQRQRTVQSSTPVCFAHGWAPFKHFDRPCSPHSHIPATCDADHTALQYPSLFMYIYWRYKYNQR